MAHRPDRRTQGLHMQAHSNSDSWSRPTSASITPDLPTRGAVLRMGEPEYKWMRWIRVPMRGSLSTSRNPVNMSEIADLPARSTKVRTNDPVRLGSQADASGACTYALSIVNDLRTPENESEHVRKGGSSLTHLIEAQKYAQRSYRL